MKSRIIDAEKLIESLDQERAQITKKIEQKKIEEARLLWRFRDLNNLKANVKGNVAINAKELSNHKQNLDKLTFANNAYRDQSIISNPQGNEINVHNLNFRMLHGSKNSAEERQLLKKVKSNLKKGAGSSSSSASQIHDNDFVENLEQIWGLHWAIHYRLNTDKEKLAKQLRTKERESENVLANAPVKGTIWTSLGSKKAIQEQIKLADEESRRSAKRMLEIQARTRRLSEELQSVEKDKRALDMRLSDICHRRYKAYEGLLELQKELAQQATKTAS